MRLDKIDRRRGAELRRICQQGLEQAAEMLSKLLAQPVRVEVAAAWMSDRLLLEERGGEPGIGISLALSGDLEGGLLLFFPEASASWLGCQLLRRSSLENLLSEPASSALKEVGNILASAFLTSFDNQYGLCCLPSPPQISRARIAELLLRLHPADSEPCMIVRTRLCCAEQQGEPLQGAIYLFPQEKSLQMLLSKLTAEPG